MGVETAIAAAVGALATGWGAYNEKRQADKAKKNQKRLYAMQRADELAERKNLIDQQREQLGGTGSATRGYSTSGIAANIGDRLG